MMRSFLTVSTGTLTSRLLGFARDAMIAALLGAGPVADAFLAAFQLVNVIRRLLSEGALNAALVPAWLRERKSAGARAAAAFAGRVLGTVSTALIIVAALIGVLMPLVMTALAPGFAGLETLHLAVDDARLMLPYLAFAGPATVLLALSSARGDFALTAFSPLLFNIALISVMAALFVWRPDASRAALAMAATVGLALPAMLGLMVLSAPIVRLLFEHGAFTALDTAATAQALTWLALALPAHVLVKSLSPAFFAREDTLAPLLAMLTGLVVALVLAVVLGHFFGAAGIAASIALGAWSNAASLIRRGAASFGFAIDAAARRRLPRIAAAALLMGALLWLSIICIPMPVHGIAQTVLVALLMAGAMTAYGLLLRLLGVIGWRETVNAIRPTKPGDLRA